MARVVVLHFDDNDAAEHFVEGVLAAQDTSSEDERLATEVMATGAIVAACSRIEALIARPTVYCKCVIVGKSRGTSRGKFSSTTESWMRTERFGWYVHARCKKPNRFVVRDFIKNMLVGIGCKNLLDELKEKMNASEPATEAQAEHLGDTEPVASHSLESEKAHSVADALSPEETQALAEGDAPAGPRIRKVETVQVLQPFGSQGAVPSRDVWGVDFGKVGE